MWSLTCSIISLRVYIMCFEHINVYSNSSQICFPSLPIQICVLFTLIPQVQFGILIYPCMYGFTLEHSLLGASLLKKTDSLCASSCQSSLTPWLAMGVCAHFTSSLCESFAWACIDFVHVLTVHEFLYAAALYWSFPPVTFFSSFS